MEAWILGMQTVFQWDMLLLIFLGTLLGLILGAVPGLTAVLGMVLLLPITFGMDPVKGLSVLIGIYAGGLSGGLVSATLLGMPGTPSSIVTTFDAFPMAKNGQPGKALGWGILASFIGGVLSWIVLVTLAPQLVKVAIKFGSFEYTALILFGLVVIVGLSEGNILKALFMTLLGLLLAMIGTDPIGGFPRFNLDIEMLRGGISFVPALIGLFVLGQAFTEMDKYREKYVFKRGKMDSLFPGIKEVLSSWGNFVRSSLIGVGIGMMPGIGATVANIVCYDQAKKASKHPEKFGTGYKEGIIASEAGNNATMGGALIPMLTLGIPGDTITAVLLGGLMLHGLQPGPFLMRDHPEVIYGLFLAMLISLMFMVIIQFTFFIRLFTVALRIPKQILLPTVIVMAIIGTYSIDFRIVDIWITVIFGVLGYILDKHNYPLMPLVIALLLGPLFENQ